MASGKFGVPKILTEVRKDGTIVLHCTDPLDPYTENVADYVTMGAARFPDRVALADRKGHKADWRSITYGALESRITATARYLLTTAACATRPVMLISENRIEAAVIQFAAYRAGIPVAPATPAYSAGKGDPARLRSILAALRPALVIIDKPETHLTALREALADAGEVRVDIVGIEPSPGVPALAEVLELQKTAAPRAEMPRVIGDTVAKILFTSGSTDAPKGSINTHRMLASNVQAIRQGWAFMDEEPPVLADWLPWNHTFGGNYVLNSVLGTGGTLYIDDGRPLPALIRRSVENNAAVRPNAHFNAPRGLDMVGRILAEDQTLAEAFFWRLHLVFFASAGLPQRIREDWLRLIDRYGRRDVSFVSAWGTTETAPLATALNFDAPQINNIGLPVPGTSLKLAPVDGRYELRVKGPNVSPGYLGRPDLNETSFDEEDYFRTGDVGRLADPDNAFAGILIDGRLAEDFKLASGVWVNVASIRAQLLEVLGPPVRDVVLAGPNRDELACLVFLDAEHCGRVFGAAPEPAMLALHDAVRAHVMSALGRHNVANTTNSRRIGSFRIMPRALDLVAGELTEKGTVRQKVVLHREQDAAHDLEPLV